MTSPPSLSAAARRLSPAGIFSTPRSLADAGYCSSVAAFSRSTQTIKNSQIRSRRADFQAARLQRNPAGFASRRGFFVGLISSKKHPSGGYPYLPPLILNRLTGRCCLRSKQRTLSKSERSLNERFRYWWCKWSAQDNGYGSPSQSSCSEGKSRRHARCYTRCEKHSE